MSKCADPVLCYTGQNKRIYRHYSLASPIVKLQHQLVFDCGKCIFCRKKKSYELAVRCVLHASLYKQNCFLTLTYDEKNPEYHNNFQYSDIQKFKKRLRRWAEYHHGKKIQVFNVHEYGKNGKKHWHLVVFNHDFEDKTLYTVKGGNRLYQSAQLSQLWPYGFSTIGDVTEASAMYQAQYTQKDIKNGNSNNAKKAHSKHSGIGRDFFLLHYAQILSLGFIPFNGRRIPIPRYYLKLAHKHFSHFYEQSNFYPTRDRKKALYTPFKPGEEKREIADLYAQYHELRQINLADLKKDWDAFIEQNAFSKEKPDFRQAAENYLYDKQNRLNSEDF